VKDKKDNSVKETCRNSSTLESQGHGRMTLRQIKWTVSEDERWMEPAWGICQWRVVSPPALFSIYSAKIYARSHICLYTRALIYTTYKQIFFMFVGPCIIIYFYSKTNQKHNISNLFYFGKTLYMCPTVSPSIIRGLRLSIIRSLRLYIQRQLYVIQVLWLLASKQSQNLYGMMLYV
jgi:hypothetical protein